MAGRAPRATLLVSSVDHGDESLSIPVAVGRRLEALAKDDSFAPSSRAELLYAVREIARLCAHSRMEDLVGRRDYSRAELTERLLRDGYRSEVVDELVERAVEVGIVDDCRYAAAFARSKVLAGWGRLKIERELSRRGISPSDVPGWPEDFVSAGDERERALSLASRRRLTGRNDYQKLVRFLCSRGFSVGISTSVAREVLDRAEG
ncbi:regulatory protein RecX [Olsenella sp. DSM 107455]|uniref:Regulatory protein RecX n=1 Tax=Thermophilibacter gallinarum TaxID=2779357 RepID=A0ABR9QU77_9ACTN|nr:regulatory protein RecX [Thermophilibacter gallinarum]MBE5024637.1 regulatory protein RecX [Thermophilibacter gallinarum]